MSASWLVGELGCLSLTSRYIAMSRKMMGCPLFVYSTTSHVGTRLGILTFRDGHCKTYRDTGSQGSTGSHQI